MTSNTKLTAWRPADTLFCALVAAVLYLRLFRLPCLPIDPAAGDQAIFLWGATKILKGQVIYKDFFQFTTPGTEYFYALLIRLFGQSAIMPKLVTLAVSVAFATAGLAISKHLLTGWRVYLPSLLFLTAGFLPQPDATHHVFSTLAVLAALLFVMPQRGSPEIAGWRLCAAGASCGLSFCFTPTRGILAVIALLVFALLFESAQRSRAVLMIAGSFVLVVFILFGPVVAKAGAHNVIACLVTYPIHNYGASPWNNLGAYGSDLPLAGFALSGKSSLGGAAGALALARWLLVYLLSPWVFIFTAMRLRRLCADDPQRKQAALVTVVGFTLFASIAYAPTAYRMGVTSLPAFVLLVWLLQSGRRMIWRSLLAALAIFAVVTIPAGILHSQGKDFVVVATPSGRVALSPAVAASAADKYRWLAAHTHPGDFLFTPDYVDYDYLFQLQHPGPTATLWVNDYTTQEQVWQTVATMDRERVQYVIWPADFQNNGGALDDRLAPIRGLLHDKYVLVYTFSGDDQVWKRRD